MEYLNSDKLGRATTIVGKKGIGIEGSVEHKAYQMCTAEKAEDMTTCIYKKLGGLVLEEAPKMVREAVETKKTKGRK